MKMKYILAICLLVLSCLLNTKAVFGQELAKSEIVSYQVSDNVFDADPFGVSFDVNLTLECRVNYTYLVQGELPGEAVCQLSAAPYSGTLAVDYQVFSPSMPDLTGSKSVVLPENGRELLGQSSPLALEIGSAYTMEIIIHGRLFGSLKVGSIEYLKIEWSAWATRTMNMEASAPVDVFLTTEYETFFTVNVSMTDSSAYDNSTSRKVLGDPAIFIIPEFPSLLVLPLSAMITLIGVLMRRKRLAKISEAP